MKRTAGAVAQGKQNKRRGEDMKGFDVLVVGDANPDLIFAGFDKIPAMGQEVFSKNVSLCLGGGAALCAAGLSKLGLKVRLMAAVGNDFYGDFIVSELRKVGVDTQYIKSCELGTGITVAMADGEDRAFMSFKGANSEMALESICTREIVGAGHIHILGYSKETHDGFKTLIKKARDCGLTVSCDVGWDPSETWGESIFEVLSMVDVFTPNEIEALNYTKTQKVEDALEELAKYVAVPAIKLGSRGSVGKKGGGIVHMPAFKVESVDATGAGDSFNAGFIYSFIKGFSMEASLSIANACGALSTKAYGGNTAFPTLEQLEFFLETERSI